MDAPQETYRHPASIDFISSIGSIASGLTPARSVTITITVCFNSAPSNIIAGGLNFTISAAAVCLNPAAAVLVLVPVRRAPAASHACPHAGAAFWSARRECATAGEARAAPRARAAVRRKRRAPAHHRAPPGAARGAARGVDVEGRPRHGQDVLRVQGAEQDAVREANGARQVERRQEPSVAPAPRDDAACEREQRLARGVEVEGRPHHGQDVLHRLRPQEDPVGEADRRTRRGHRVGLRHDEGTPRLRAVRPRQHHRAGAALRHAGDQAARRRRARGRQRRRRRPPGGLGGADRPIGQDVLRQQRAQKDTVGETDTVTPEPHREGVQRVRATVAPRELRVSTHTRLFTVFL